MLRKKPNYRHICGNFDMHDTILFVFSLLFCLPGFSFAAEVPGKTFTGRVCLVRDGDSIQLKSGRNFYEIRLYGVDAPEHTQPKALVRKMWLRHFLLGKSVTATVVARDRYHRLVAIVSTGEKIVNEELIRHGLAWVYPRYCRKKICRVWKRLEKEARREQRGIWRQRHPVPPWVWRHRRR